jgi:dihydrofolate reductase
VVAEPRADAYTLVGVIATSTELQMQLSVFIATSLDGFIARQDDRIDWLPANGGEPHGYVEFMATVDAVVLGRRSFEQVLKYEAWPYPTKPVIVLTSRPETVVAPKGAVCDAMCGTPLEVVNRLADRGMKHLYIDGGVTVQRFLEAGLIQHVTITRIPVLLGSGIALFGPLSRDIRFKHIATRTFPSGMVQSQYVVA